MFNPKAPTSNGVSPYRIEGQWAQDWYGGGLKFCQLGGKTLVLFSLCDWRWEASGVIPTEQVFFSGIVTLEGWEGWSDSFRTKRRDQPYFLLNYLNQIAIGGVKQASTLAKARAAATVAFRALRPRVGRTPAPVGANLLY